MDLNDGLGLPTSPPDPEEAKSVGPLQPRAAEHFAATEFRKILSEYSLAAANTVAGHGGPTDFGPNGSSRIDYVIMPAALCSHIRHCGIWARSGRRLQHVNVARPHGHWPLAFSVSLSGIWARRPPTTDTATLDPDALVRAYINGHQRQGFLTALEKICDEKRQTWSRLADELTPDPSWDSLVQDIRDAALTVYFLAKDTDVDRKAARLEQRVLLVQRVQLRVQLGSLTVDDIPRAEKLAEDLRLATKKVKKLAKARRRK